MDSKTIVAVIVCVGIFFGWNKYMTYKYPSFGKPVATPVTQKAGSENPQVPSAASANVPSSGSQDLKPNANSKPEQLIPFSSATLNFSVSNRGMGLKNVVLSSFTDYENKAIRLGDSDTDGLFELRWGPQAQVVDFDIKKTGENTFSGEAFIGAVQIKREIVFDKEKYAFTSKTTVMHANEEALKGIRFLVPEKITAKESTSFLFPSYEHQDLFIEHAGKEERVHFSSAKENLRNEFQGVSVLSLSSQYFATAVIDKSEIAPEVIFTSHKADKTALAEVIYKPASLRDTLQFDQIFYVGPKAIDVLKSVDAKLPSVFDFGWFGVIAMPLLYVMKAFYSLVGNWGLAIILLTLLVRLVVLPFNLMSFKSMKAMQKIQPMMTSLRERYKDDPVRMNQEVMALMKENKANPLGGCLPMLLQIPVFFALYRVIGSSIELYKSPFFGWISDLSSFDHYYVLPVLMGATMFVQQKLTPTNMDPAQAKIMAFLPLVFSVFMLQLPSGLTLYMFVSGLFGITQQFFMLQKKA